MPIRHLKIQRKPSKKEETKDALESIQKDLQTLVDQVEECLEKSSPNTLLDQHIENEEINARPLIKDLKI